MRPAVFLDRDDTINVNADLPPEAWRGTPGDLLDPDHTRLLPGVDGALRALKRAGYALVVITNQGGVARAHGSIEDVERVNDRLRALLPLHAPGERPDAPDHAPVPASLIDAFYACPFHPSGVDARFADEHPWRKPAGGMIAAACRELSLDPARSWMVGDKQRDLDAAIAAGIPRDRALLIAPGAECQDLPGAAARILRPAGASGGTGGPTIVPASRITLHADLTIEPRPLSDERVRETVIAAARAIAERTGVRLLDVQARDTAVSAVLAASRVAAMGFAAELRRTTNDWHAKRHNRALWLDRDA